MATLILTIGGYVAFGPLGGFIGGLAGGFIDRTWDPFGLQPDPIHAEGPRLDTLKVQYASYGRPIDRTWGTIRKAGELIWSLDLEEEASTTEQGGKGGGGGGNTVTQYFYYGTFAVSFGYGRPGMQLKKLWCDGKLCYVNDNVRTYTVDVTCSATLRCVEMGDSDPLIYLDKTAGVWTDVGLAPGQQVTLTGFVNPYANGSWTVQYVSGSTAGLNWRGGNRPDATETASATITSSSYYDSATVDWPAGSDDFAAYMEFHSGTIDQTADATIQASVGVSSTPAYREQCYASFDRLPLKHMGNRIPNITAELVYETSLITVVEDLCTLGGLDSDEYDLTGLAGLGEIGGVIHSGGDSREMIRQLAQAYYFDFIESEGKIKAVPNKTASDITLTTADLGAAAGDEKARAMSHTYSKSRALPRQISLTYLSAAMDYDPATCVIRREVVMSCVRKEINVPVVLTAAEARALADHLMRKSWIERTSYSFTLPRKYMKIEPADLITLPADYGSAIVKVTKSRISPAGVVGIEAVRASVFTLPAATTEADPGGYTPVQDADWHSSQLFLLDIPILRDLDDDAGLYAAAYTWRDGSQTIYRAGDSTNYAAYSAVSHGAVVGNCTAVLADCVTPDLWDRKNSLVVTLRSSADTLESKSESEVLSGANQAYLGGEIFQYQTAALTTTNTYTLSGLLRGRRGTEQYTGTHAAGETFILLQTADLARISTAVSEFNAAYQYKGVADRETVITVAEQSLTKQCIGLKPYSPAHVHGAISTSGDWLFEWKRRGRVNSGWNSLADIPADSTLAESYEIDVMTNTTSTAVKRTLGSTTTSVTYTVAQQTSDFGAAATAVTINAYQLGPLGRGFGKKEILP